LTSGGRQPPVKEQNRGLTPPARPGTGFIVTHTRYRAWLAKCGVATAADALALTGEVVCGHPDRHVVRAELGSGRRVVFLKREHVVGWRVRLKNRLAGFGPVSRAGREAAVLRQLERLGLPGPQWLAYGEDGTGRAFLLVDGLAGHAELRDLLCDARLTPADRRDLAVRLGRAVADLHDAGFDTPDLSAKHVFVRPETLLPTLIDWQSSRRRPLLGLRERVRALAVLVATTADGLAAPRERLRVLWAYRRSVRWPAGRPRFADLVRLVRAEAAALAGRSSVREQRSPAAPAQRLVWLAGEEVCVRPDLVTAWPVPAAGPPFYPADARGPTAVTLPGVGPAVLVRFCAPARPGWLDRLLGRPWRSPGVTLARVFFHLERHGVPAPRLLAFGQRRSGPCRGDSFVLYAGGADDSLRGSGPTLDRETLHRVLFAVGAAVRAMHGAGCRLGHTARAPELVRVDRAAAVSLDPTHGVHKVRTVSLAARQRDLRTVLDSFSPALSRPGRLRVIAGYFAGDGRTAVRAAAHRLMGGRTAR
jgi:tRNA A-37 threonylcarbamoyl transferase component Bud32